MLALCCINRGFESHCRLICFQLFLFQNSTVNAYDDTADVAVKTIYLVRDYWKCAVFMPRNASRNNLCYNQPSCGISLTNTLFVENKVPKIDSLSRTVFSKSGCRN